MSCRMRRNDIYDQGLLGDNDVQLGVASDYEEDDGDFEVNSEYDSDDDLVDEENSVKINRDQLMRLLLKMTCLLLHHHRLYHQLVHLFEFLLLLVLCQFVQ